MRCQKLFLLIMTKILTSQRVPQWSNPYLQGVIKLVHVLQNVTTDSASKEQKNSQQERKSTYIFLIHLLDKAQQSLFLIPFFCKFMCSLIHKTPSVQELIQFVNWQVEHVYLGKNVKSNDTLKYCPPVSLSVTYRGIFDQENEVETILGRYQEC